MSNRTPPATQLDRLIRSRYPVILISSFEEARITEAVYETARDQEKSLFVWSVSQGLRRVEKGPDDSLTFTTKPKDPAPDETQEPTAALKALYAWGTDRPAIFIFKDLHGFAQDPATVRWIRDIAGVFQEQTNTLILLSPQFVVAGQSGLPADLEKDVAVMDWPLPYNGEIESILDLCANSVRGQVSRRTKKAITVDIENGTREAILRAMSGLTAFEAKSVLSMAVVTHGALDERAIPLIIAEKKQIVKKTGFLEFFDTNVKQDEIGGLDLLKEYTRKKRAAFSDEARAYGLPAPRGFLMVGVPGSGKSLTAKASTGGQMPLLRLDVGALMGGLVGLSEANTRAALNLAEAVAPCVLWIDEIEKGLGGMGGGENDGGTTKRVFGTLLTWMQEHTSPVYVVATANDVSGLPPELLRRFDDLFWVDLPSQDEREAILRIHLQKCGRNPADFELKPVADEMFDFTGAEIEKVVNAALVIGFDDGARQITTADLLEAAREIVPVSRTMEAKIKDLRDWADTRARPASSKQPAATPAAKASRIEV